MDTRNTVAAKSSKFFDRDLSWLSFNYRVLLEATDKSLPLYERIKFLAIYSSNLDELKENPIFLIYRLLYKPRLLLSNDIRFKCLHLCVINLFNY